MIKTYRILSSLLDYPGQELWENLGEVEPLVKAEGITETGPESPLGTFLSWARGFKSLREWQAEYSSLFDSNSAERLYLFDFVYGTNRDRGQAMEDLRESYAASGMDCSASELPDYVPLFLEFVSAQPTEEDAKRVLAEVGGVLRMMERRFIDRKRPYAPLITILRTLSGAAPRLVTTEKIAIRAEDN